jgi:outer membrane protein OmpU
MFNIKHKQGVLNMNNYKKIGLTALAGSLVAGSVSAAEMSAAGTATMSFTGGDEKANHGNGWVMEDSVTFSASGDVNDIGVTYSVELDGDASATSGAGNVDSYSLTFDLGDAGTLVFGGHGTGGFMDGNDDVMPTASEEPWDVITGADTSRVNGFAGDNAFKYTYAHESGLNVHLYYVNASGAADGTDVSYSDYGITYTGMDGLTLGYGEGDVEVTTGTKSNDSTMYAKYAIGGATIGIQTAETDNESASDIESTGVGISYAINDDLTVSYGSNTREKVGSKDQEATAIGASYTMGSLGIAVSMHQVDNVNNSAADDREGYQMVLTFAF